MRHCLNLLLLSLLGTVGGCAVTLPQPESAQLAPKASAWQTPLPTTSHLAEQQVWWQSWQDPVLNTLLNAAQQANPTLEFAEARIREARAKAYATKAYLWPTVGATASGSRSHNTMIAPAQPINAGSVGLDASWEIDLWGGVRTAEKKSAGQFIGQNHRMARCTSDGGGRSRQCLCGITRLSSFG
ncbi:hypothetical protein GKO28_05190 [Deefgea sp. CFH1-16]|nr:TolC family protein [Deefgea sp. CFH1-16]MBM5573818.1 hypothetical protein [Deefgea sp. CFH1-16]